MRTLEWDNEKQELKMIDQCLLPGRLEIASCSDSRGVAVAIRDMVVRGAPAIGVAAAYGVALGALRCSAKDPEGVVEAVHQAAAELKAARPTAVNLAWAVDHMVECAQRMDGSAADVRAALLAEAHRMADEDVEINLRIARNGAELIQDGDTIIHHCNTGALATVDWGTALGAIRMAHESGKRVHVLVDETRPRLQGARLTAWELGQYGIPYEIISDNAAGFFLHTGQAQKVFFGADRVAANGDVANKIGSYMLALAANDNRVPVYSVFPVSTVDLTIANGDAIPIEERTSAEVLDIQLAGVQVTPLGAAARNPAFDVTPARLITALVTENGVVYPPYSTTLPRALHPSLAPEEK